VLALALLAVTGCGTSAGGRGTEIERSFDVHWHDRASELAVHYRTDRIVFHRGRWSVGVTVTNESDKPLYETTWSPPGDIGAVWDGPALVYSGRDVLGNRRLIFVPADTETPEIAFPLKPGTSWHGTIEGRIPSTPRLPRKTAIWVRYPMFGIGQVWDGLNSALAVQWISRNGVQL
jgi:hypothetical protein